MKTSILFLALLSTVAFASDEFLPGRIQSRTASRTILAKCALRDATTQECNGFQFFYSHSGKEGDAELISERVYTESTLKDLKEKPILFNLMRNDGEGLNTVDYVEFLNDYEDSWGESVVARVGYTVGRGICYGVITPVVGAIDAIGLVAGAPVTLVVDTVSAIRNTKINKLLRAIRSGKKKNMDIDRVYRLRDMLR